MDVAATERAEAELNRLVERQPRRTGADEANALAAMWRASEKAHAAKQREEHRDLWLDYHQGQAARLRSTLEALVSKHEAAAAELLEEKV